MIQLDSQAKSIIEIEAVLQARIALKRAQLEKLSLSVTEQNPDFESTKTELAALQKALQQVESDGQKNGRLDFSLGKLPASGLE